MNYYQFAFTIVSGEDFYKDLLINSLSDAGFDTFEDTPEGFNAYIPETEFNEEVLNRAVSEYSDKFAFSFKKTLIPQKNWNEVWESNFEPLIIQDQCYVRATFHQPRPEFQYEIIIDPKMAFGTGHHQTTTMMMEYILEEDFLGKTILDMGCGTGILAILAEKRGAKNVIAIDYDIVCFESTMENAKLNQVSHIQALCGSKEDIPDIKFDVILANINRNILLDQIGRYAEALNVGGQLFMSGFYKEDIPLIEAECNLFDVNLVSHKCMNNWVCVKFLKH